MRFAVFVFSILLIFSTTYAHALAFVPAAVGGLVRMAGGQVMKVASKKGLLYTAGGAAVFSYCKKNQKKCKDIIGDTLGDYFFGDDDNSCPNGQRQRVRIQGLYYKDFETACNSVPYSKVFSNPSSYEFTGNRKIGNQGYNDRRTCGIGYLHHSTNTERFFNVEMVQSCFDEAKVTEQENEQLAQKITQHLSDDDIDQIINNYSKEIEVNIDKYCATPNACVELDKSFGDEVMNNKNKYDIDKINKDNCEVKNNKIISCDKAKKEQDKKDDEDSKKKEDGQQNDDNAKPKDDDKPVNCDGSQFHKKVCDFIDWYQSDDYNKGKNELTIQDDTPKPTNTNIEFSGSCPASYVVSHTLHFGLLGSYDFEFTLLDTPKLCGFLNDWIKPIMMFLGPLHAVYIIGKRDE